MKERSKIQRSPRLAIIKQFFVDGELKKTDWQTWTKIYKEMSEN